MNAFIGQPLERLEDECLLKGQAAFVDDVQIEGTLHMAVLRSPVAHGRIVKVGLDEAKASEGVVAAFDGKDLESLPLLPVRLAPIAGVERYLQRAVALDKVRFVGEPVAVVVARTPELAEDALEKIELEIDPLPAIVDRETALRPAALLFEENGSNVAAQYTVSNGDAAAAFADAPYTRRETFYSQRQASMTMETRGLLAHWNASEGKMRVWGATKVLWFNRKFTAEMLGLPVEQVVMMGTDVGGSFGVRGELHPEDLIVPFVARKLDRPVKWIEDRRENLMAANHSREITCELEIACEKDGRVRGLRGKFFADMGAYTRTNGGIVPSRAGQFIIGPYRIPAVESEVVLMHTNKTPIGTYRGPGRIEANFFRERIFDLAAADLGIDPAEFRRKNLITEAELPYSMGKMVPFENPFIYDTGDYHAGLQRVLDTIGYEELARKSGEEIDGRRQGVGLSCFIEASGAGPKENAKLVLEPDGHVAVHTGCTFVGQGLRTTLTQVAADSLGLDIGQLTVHNAETSQLDEGFGTFASRGAIKGGSAVVEGARNFIEALLKFSSEVIGRAQNDIEWSNGAVRTHDGALLFDLEHLAKEAAKRGQSIEAVGNYFGPDITFSYGAHAVHVAVDPRTGVVEVLDYFVVEDIGRAINPLVVHGQLIGSVVQGLGGAFLDHIVYDEEGQLLTGTLADYLVPTATDFPVVHGHSYGDRRSKNNPLGVKGAGEGGIVGVAAAVANAVAAAIRPLGAEITSLPLSPMNVWQAIQEGRK